MSSDLKKYLDKPNAFATQLLGDSLKSRLTTFAGFQPSLPTLGIVGAALAVAERSGAMKRVSAEPRKARPEAACRVGERPK